MTIISAGIINASDVTLTVIDDFESYTAGNTINNEAAEWGQCGSRSLLVVENQNSVEGSQELGRVQDGFTTYFATQSTTDASTTTDQTDTFDNYPEADCTIRAGYRAVGTDNGSMDMAFAIPSNETDFNSNCYRLRVPGVGGGANPPFLRRTVGGSSTQLESFTNPLSADTTYDMAVEFEATGSSVELTARIWEWDSGTSSWSEHDSEISASDGGNNFPDEAGVGFAGVDDINNAGEGFVWDHLRFYDALGQNGEPEWTV